jgi:hypothetical protein
LEADRHAAVLATAAARREDAPVANAARFRLAVLGCLLLACDGGTPAASAVPEPGRSGGAGGGNQGSGGGGGTVAGTGGDSPGAEGGSGGAGGSAGGAPDAGAGDTPDSYLEPPPPDPTATVVQAFKDTHVFFLADNNQRKVDVDVDFPATGPWKAVTMKLALTCPAPRQCDFWDRWAYIGVVNGTERESPVTEIMRFATPFHLEATFNADVTALQPLLAGKKRLRVFIDTWVGPGSNQGTGWKVDVSFAFSPGKPARLPIAVLPLWDVASFETGNPAKPIDAAVPAKMVNIPAQAGAVELRAFITGHGQGNLQNCAEFCPKTHSFTVGGKTFDKRIWRDDCARNPLQPQPGSWQFNRAGWCPGALAEPWVADVSAAAAAGSAVSIGYTHEPYVNSCRPDSPTCAGCALKTGCMYDDGNHTAPNYVHSALLVVYARP